MAIPIHNLDSLLLFKMLSVRSVGRMIDIPVKLIKIPLLADMLLFIFWNNLLSVTCLA